MPGSQNSNRHGGLANVAMPPDSQPEGMIVSDKTTIPAEESGPDNVTDVHGDIALREGISNGLSRQRKWIIMFALCTAVFIVALDYFILTTALPTVTSEFGTSDAGFAWIGSAYLLTHAAFTPVWATISDVFGRKMVLNVTNGFFFAGVLIGGLSGNTAILIVGRAIQGVGAAGIMVVAPICVGHLFNQRERAHYIVILGAVIAFSSAAGPFIGGILTERLSWRWCFWINLPFTGLSFIALTLFLHIESPNIGLIEGLQLIDWLGSVTIVGATVMLLLGLQLGVSQYAWDSVTVVCLIIFGTATFGIFGFIEYKVAKTPIIPLKLFARRPRVAVMVVCICQASILAASTYFLPLYFQIVLGASPSASGIYFLPTTLTLALFLLAVGHIIQKTGRYIALVRTGACALLLGTGFLVDTKAYLSWPRIIVSQIVVGSGLGLLNQSPLVALYEVIDPQDVTTGTSAYQFLKIFSETISVILGQVIFQSQVQRQSAALLHRSLPPSVISALKKGQSILLAYEVKNLEGELQELIHDAFVVALKRMWIFYTVISFLAVVASMVIIGKKLTR
ncbi:hypothetical protein EPUS_08333 [Endocarpon pusillum Z07020]|uniref:Major facilitator superfamily (MFS) profile domain-containing protein n=1 Tax=Endocarpon pusillum (strain Z07020 / HMAS-L-300199) TaxID=1263415 RepID=U1HKK8_ENDPU|nr:uncharacterized protein EPUS_08333 [Endocarpon pusillum Z07020]ERF70775.1 hypothetical protein EPUS_08333 [Endocarpon pusillum Z07020]